MSQIFHPSTNTISRVSIFGGLFMVLGLVWLSLQIGRSSYVTQAGVAREQPVPFSHAHHVGAIGIDCRYCHTAVEDSSFAGIPPTKICMNCHSQLYNDSPTLEPVRASFRTGDPIVWTRVHDLPDFVFFNHSIHVRKGVACVTCHGRVDRMSLVWQESSLLMEWCVGCHRSPAGKIQSRDSVTRMEPIAPAEGTVESAHLLSDYKIKTRTDCSTCHR